MVKKIDWREELNSRTYRKEARLAFQDSGKTPYDYCESVIFADAKYEYVKPTVSEFRGRSYEGRVTVQEKSGRAFLRVNNKYFAFLGFDEGVKYKAYITDKGKAFSVVPSTEKGARRFLRKYDVNLQWYVGTWYFPIKDKDWGDGNSRFKQADINCVVKQTSPHEWFISLEEALVGRRSTR